jgi:hypothetical protein
MNEKKEPAFVTPEGFLHKYFQNCRKCKTNLEAYELTETEYATKFGVNKYSSYDSFRIIKNRKFKQN